MFVLNNCKQNVNQADSQETGGCQAVVKHKHFSLRYCPTRSLI